MEAPLKGVILAGGTGSRLHPLTRITNKHLLPIYDRPMVTYAIEALVKAGVTELMLVTGGTHAGEFFRLLGNGHEYGIDRLAYAYQENPGGIAEALGLAERFGRGDRIVVMLADNVVERSLTSGSRSTCAISASPSSTATASSGLSRNRPIRPASTPSPGSTSTTSKSGTSCRR
jgi:dTDP-glucose pyrophosphorylase